MLPDSGASLIKYCASSFSVLWAWRCSGIGTVPQFSEGEGVSPSLTGSITPAASLIGTSVNTIASRILPFVSGHRAVPAGTSKETQKARMRRFVWLLKDEQVFAIYGMVTNGAISADHDHITDLAFASVTIRTVRHQPISISVFVSAMAGENKNARHACWRCNATLLLATIAGMDVGAPIIAFIDGERPIHRASTEC